MKNLFHMLVFLFFSCIPFLQAQILSIPYAQHFEDPFLISPDSCTKQSCAVEFLPGFWGNTVTSKSRIYQDTSTAFDGTSSLAMVPTSTFAPEVILKLRLPSWKMIQLSIQVTSGKNGNASATKASMLFSSYSVNEGKSYSEEILVDTFQNVSGDSYRMKTLIFSNPLKWEDLWIKLKGKRDEDAGEGTAAKIIIDGLFLEHINDLTETWTEAKEPFKATYDAEREMLIFNRKRSGKIQDMTGRTLNMFENTISIPFAEYTAGTYIIITGKHESFKLAKFY